MEATTPNRILPVTFLLAALVGLSCSGESHGGGSTTTGGTGGSTTTGGTGGSTTTGGTGGAASPCELLCEYGTCAGDICTVPDRLLISAIQGGYVDVYGTVDHLARASACSMTGYSTRVAILSTEEPCWLVRLEPLEGMTFLPIDIGTITISTPSAGTIELSPDGLCPQADLSPDGLFSGGEVVLAHGEGDADLPAFSLATTAPTPIDLHIPKKLTPGEPFHIIWAPSDPPDYIVFSSSASPEANTLLCRGNAQGELTISPTLTAGFDPHSPSGTVSAVRSYVARTSVGPDSLRTLLDAMVVEAAETIYGSGGSGGSTGGGA